MIRQYHENVIKLIAYTVKIENLCFKIKDYVVENCTTFHDLLSFYAIRIHVTVLNTFFCISRDLVT